MVQFSKSLHFSAFLFLKEYENVVADLNFPLLKFWASLINMALVVTRGGVLGRNSFLLFTHLFPPLSIIRPLQHQGGVEDQ